MHVLSSIKSLPEELCVERILTIGTFNMCPQLLMKGLLGQILCCVPVPCPCCPEKAAVTQDLSSCWTLVNLGGGYKAVLFNTSYFPEVFEDAQTPTCTVVRLPFFTPIC